ncbi:hypothetical protein BJ138DRAFT_1099419 [Hygrophoropsis aurantiaca]|uniref:Uncharacterized protein n=1 Tax=Hygrophoropsis aurantiaca TaxID=72124 RepID=A0ACB8AK47_9AGAM|nr:hypothetical protein BJ138DRAFT_1099419 [Hygrophoropsis aurantiaca]
MVRVLGTYCAIASLLSVAIAASSNTDTTVVVADINNLSAQVSDLNGSVNTYVTHPTSSNFAGVLTATQVVDKAIQKTTNDAVGVLSPSDSKAVLSALQSAQPVFEATLQNIANSKVDFGDEASYIAQGLVLLAGDTANLSIALLNIAACDAGIRGETGTVAKAIGAGFTRALNAYV